jgi:hypothetical protein
VNRNDCPTWLRLSLPTRVFCDITPCSPLKVKPTFRRNISSSESKYKPSKKPGWKQVAGDWVLARIILSTVKMEATYSSGTSIWLSTDYTALHHTADRAIAQAVSRWLPTAAARGSRPGRVMWDLEWTKWRWGRFSPSTSVSPANLHSTNFSTITIIYHPGLVQ